MWTLAILVVCLIAGAAVRRRTLFAGVISKFSRYWVIWVALPAMILREVPRMTFDSSALLLFAAGFVVFAGATLWVRLIGNARGWSRPEIAAITLTAGLGNTSFIGLPVMRLAYGEHAIGPALLVDQSSFVALAIGGTTIAAWGAGKKLSPRLMAERIFLFPPTVAVLIALVLTPTGWIQPLADLLGMVAITLSPVALFAVGLQFKDLHVPRWEPLFTGLAWKLLLAPLVIFALMMVTAAEPFTTQVAVLQAGMPPMVTAAIVAESEGLEAELASRMVLIGLIASSLTLTAFWFLL